MSDRDYSRRDFLSILGSAAAFVFTAGAEGGGPIGRFGQPTDASSGTRDRSSGSTTCVVEKSGSSVVARTKHTGPVVADSSNARDAIQAALDRSDPGDTIHIREGVYHLDSRRRLGIRTDDLEVKGDGIGRTILKMEPDINEEAGPMVSFTEEARGSILHSLEIDGNEAENRQIPPYPDSPAGHGLIVNGDSNTVEDVFVHDTIRSNIVLNGTECELQRLRLKNSATDHWLYITDGDNCTVRDVHASGFARKEGLVFGVGLRTCRDNVVEDVVIEDAQVTPNFDPQATDLEDEVLRHYPQWAIGWRPDRNASNNVVRNVSIRDPHPNYGQRIVLGHGGATLRNFEYEGPAGFLLGVVTTGLPDDAGSGGGDAPNVTVADGTIEVTESLGEQAIIWSRTPSFTCEAVEVRTPAAGDLRGVRLHGSFREVSDNQLSGLRIASGGPALVADGSQHPVTDLLVSDVVDVRCTGVVTMGKVSFAEKDIRCP